eukprot:CAMPEP_0168734824 /NCGR_PEP_ID=MMETSP0724-20121128/9015_1 /TAXON_ID=265536 /ORGANISM="Amphiprora sp., Strain CCMP467" /LENGTH=507 /DNA_ID=CAMNT_0008781945 /DNA_START=73 /DNA_END=1596 /DNA_ORIENTATION=+
MFVTRRHPTCVLLRRVVVAAASEISAARRGVATIVQRPHPRPARLTTTNPPLPTLSSHAQTRAPLLRQQRHFFVRRESHFSNPLSLRLYPYRSTTTPISKRSLSSNGTAAAAPQTTTITTHEVSELRQELQELKDLIKAQRSQSYHVESLTRAVSAQTKLLETRLVEIEHHVSQIRAVHTLLETVRDFLQHNPATKQLLKQLETVAKLVGVNPIIGRGTTTFVREHYPAALAVGLVVAGLIWNHRATVVYERTSEEVAHLARKTLEQESLRQSIQETINVIVNHPQTLKLLNDLVQQLVTHPQTQRDLVHLLVYAIGTPDVQRALLNLLHTVFRDEQLQRVTGEFLLKGLDTDSVKAMLDAQTAELIRGTVSDVSVQQATAAGVQKSLWYAVTPPFLWQLLRDKRRRETQMRVHREQQQQQQQQQEQSELSGSLQSLAPPKEQEQNNNPNAQLPPGSKEHDSGKNSNASKNESDNDPLLLSSEADGPNDDKSREGVQRNPDGPSSPE